MNINLLMHVSRVRGSGDSNQTTEGGVREHTI